MFVLLLEHNEEVIMKKIKNELKNNKGLIMFYVCVAVFAFFWANVVDTSNDKVMNEKNGYILSENVG